MDNAERLMFQGWASLPQFQQKLEKAKALVKEALTIAPSYVACSWGKDSIVLAHLCQQVQPDILIFHYASIESSEGIVDNYPCIISTYREKFNPNYQELIAKREWAKTPDTVQDRINSSIDSKYKLAFVGLRAEESKPRRIVLRQYGLIHQYQSGKHKGKYRACPLAWWGWKDIYAYCVAFDLPLLSRYDRDDKSLSRTNPHGLFWYSKDKDFVAASREQIKRFNPVLNQYLNSHEIP